MAFHYSIISSLILLLLSLSTVSSCTKNNTTEDNIDVIKEGPEPEPKPEPAPLPQPDFDMVEIPLNWEYLESEWFLWGAHGHGLDVIAPELTGGGPPPIGGRKANLDPIVHSIIYQFGFIDMAHLRILRETVKSFPRIQLDLSSKNFAHIMDQAVGYPLYPPFDPYANSVNYLLASYYIGYVCVTGAVGATTIMHTPQGKKLVAGLLSTEAGQDAVIRTLLFERRLQTVHPYRITVQEFTNKISNLKNKLGKGGIKDEGLLVQPAQGAEGKTPLNILSEDSFSVGYPRTAEELLRIFYTTGTESVAGGFYPNGCGGRLARSYLTTS